ncbi:hypothetical protein COLO4_13452 [Corchorus olitorius]|uniref:Uncharacterized protein n=1 Tax=Corchorus olitorius TaxID=93759 RepID=A0A1R3JWG9_9ROSI|nr:hypothetical protein COLO4_13452 [Corchorus olitorius]
MALIPDLVHCGSIILGGREKKRRERYIFSIHN